jgi:hypothetical protein
MVALVQGIKQILPENLYKFLRLFNCILWVLIAYWYIAALNITDMNNAMIIMGWILLWLASSWLYEFGKDLGIMPTAKK